MGTLQIKKRIIVGVVGCWIAILLWLILGPDFTSRWRNLRDGMTQEEVRRALGNPNWTNPPAPGVGAMLWSIGGTSEGFRFTALTLKPLVLVALCSFIEQSAMMRSGPGHPGGHGNAPARGHKRERRLL